MTTKSDNLSFEPTPHSDRSEMETTTNTTSTELGHSQRQRQHHHHHRQYQYQHPGANRHHLNHDSSSADAVIRSHNFNANRRSSHSDVSHSRNPLPSGLSALLLAATSQLGHLAEAGATENIDVSGLEHSRVQSEDTTMGAASSSSPDLSPRDHPHSEETHQRMEQMHKLKQARQQKPKPQESETTPKMVPEPDPRNQTFPVILMTLALDPSNADVITFLPDGKFFAIRTHKFAETLMRHYFSPPIQ